MFLIFSGLSIFIAWMPDILESINREKSLSLIEVYTTEITYVLDMGIVSPLCFLCLHLIKKQDSTGVLILYILLELCIVIGVMMVPQTIMQILSGFDVPIIAILTKSVIFMILVIIAKAIKNNTDKELLNDI